MLKVKEILTKEQFKSITEKFGGRMGKRPKGGFRGKGYRGYGY
jgi:hypothetical protein